MSKARQVRRGGPTAAPLKALPSEATIYSLMSGWASVLQSIYGAPGVWHAITNTYATNTAPGTVLNGAIDRTQVELGHLRLDAMDFDVATAPTKSGDRYVLYLRYRGPVTTAGDAAELPDGDGLAEYVEGLDPDSDEYVAITGEAGEQ